MILSKAKSNEVAERIRDAVERALTAQNLSARRASLDVVGHDGLIRDIRAGRIPSADRVAALFEYLGLEAYFGPKRTGQRSAGLRLVTNMDPEDDAPSGFATIPLLSDATGASTAPVAFSFSWLQRQKLTPDFLRAAVPDDFLIAAPPLAGSVALLDTRTTRREGTGLWCFRDGGRIKLGYMTFSEDIAVVHPAAPEDEAQIYKGRSALLLGLLGKVVWLGQLVPLKGKVG